MYLCIFTYIICIHIYIKFEYYQEKYQKPFHTEKKNLKNKLYYGVNTYTMVFKITNSRIIILFIINYYLIDVSYFITRLVKKKKNI